jgi:hypothetical protein
MNHYEKDQMLGYLMECFPEVDPEKLSVAVEQSADQVEAIDFVMAHFISTCALCLYAPIV